MVQGAWAEEGGVSGLQFNAVAGARGHSVPLDPSPLKAPPGDTNAIVLYNAVAGACLPATDMTAGPTLRVGWGSAFGLPARPVGPSGWVE